MLGCNYCRKGKAFWILNADAAVCYQNACIIPDTNTFSDTTGRRINFRYCPMCGESLLRSPNNRSGLSGVFSTLLLQRRIAH